MDPRYQQNPRSGGLPPSLSPQRPPQPQQSPQKTPGQMTRAEKFEDEKRRIMDSCFNKYDETGQLSESYITHIRVTEDSSFPQTPHPPDSPSANKERLIIVAVRNTGRVRVHKARENANHTFSIGKTWNLEDLSAVQSWAHFQPRNADEERFKSWAGDIGFTVTMIKPYYWQASTPKEKEFFVASLVKIYRKYTKGGVPDLVGFLPHDIEQMVGGQGRSPSGGSPGPGPAPQIPTMSPGRGGQRGLSPGEIPTSSPRLPVEPPPRNRPPTSGSGQGSFFSQRAPSSSSSTPPPGSMYSSDPPREVNRMPSREQMRPPGGQRITPSASMTNLGAPRDRTPDSFASRPSTSGRDVDRRSPSRTRDGFGATSGPGAAGRPPNGAPIEDLPPLPRPGPPNGFGGSRSRTGSQDSLPDTALPERRRPFMPSVQSNGSQASFKSTQGPRPPLNNNAATASTDSLVKRTGQMPGGFVPTPAMSPAPSTEVEKSGLLPAPLSPKPKVDPAAQIDAPRAQPTAVLPNPDPQTEVKEDPKPEIADSPAPALSESQKKAAEEEAARPGLGRMFGGNKKSAKDMFKSAANAYGAFVPRAGGAGARLRAGTTDKEAEGITGVFKAPELSRTQTDDSVRTDATDKDSSIQATPTSAKAEVPTPEVPPASTVPEVMISSPVSPQRAHEPIPVVRNDSNKEAAATAAAAAAQKKAKQAEEERRKKRRSATQTKYLSQLGIDAALLENKGLEFEAALDDLGWGSTGGNNMFQSNKRIETIEADIRREIARIEAGSWLGHMEHKDDRVEAVEKLLDKAIAECDELDGLLTLYSVELSSLNDDIAFIEAQSQGLQVQTANQKLLQLELQNLVKTISIGPRELEPLKKPMPNSPQGLESIEKALLILYKAMVTIDPSIRQNSGGVKSLNNAGMLGNSELSSMIALQEKSDQYLSECSMFLKRFTQHMDLTFGAAMLDAKEIIGDQKAANGAKLSSEPFDAARMKLWQYSPLMLFAKEIDRTSWDGLLRLYQARARPLYQEELGDNAMQWKKLAQKPTGDEHELLFTYNAEKEGESLTGTARRITVKRSQTLARGLRVASTEKDKERSSKGLPTGSMFPFEAFKGALDEMSNAVFIEQNFIVEFFHATGTESIDFADAVATALPENRRGGALYNRKAFESDRDIARRVADAMGDIFISFEKELGALIKWATDASPLQGIGIMYALSRKLTHFEDTNQDFLTATMSTQSQRLAGLWTKFVDDQVRAIESTRKINLEKGRTGVIGFIKTFPDFSAAIENQLPPSSEESALTSETRKMVDEAYERLNKAMFDTIRTIAKEHQSRGGAALQAAREDPEDKGALNYHVLLIENMNHYVEEVDVRGDVVLQDGVDVAREELEDHLGVYVESVVRRPLGKIMDFLTTLSLALSALPPSQPPTALATRVQTSKSAFKKLLADQGNHKKLREKLSDLVRRVEKHFMDGDDANLSRELVNKVLSRCETKYNSVFEKVVDMARDVYEETEESLPGKDEVGRWFRGAR